MGWSLISTRRADSRRPPIGVNFHGLEALQDSQDLLTTVKNCFAPIWLKWNLRHADCVLSLGGTLDDLVHRVGVPYDLILPSPNGIAAEWFESESGGENSTKCRFLFVGRDTDRKGFRELNRVLPSFLAAHNCEIHFAGDIDPARQISHPSVVYHGMIRSEDQLRRLYQLSDVLLCPSHSEGMPTVILEAAASGVPAIATDVGAVRLMVNEETGWLIPARNCAALEIAMQQAFRSDLAAKADAARQKAASFRWDAVARTTAGAISRFLQRRQTQVA